MPLSRSLRLSASPPVHRFNVLPYETQPSDRFILKLHGDVRAPADIVLTRSQMLDSREQRKALSVRASDREHGLST